MTSDALYSFQDVVAFLSPSLGEERSQELVRAALTSLGIADDTFPLSIALRVLESVGRTPGVAGTVARFALARLTLVSAKSSLNHEKRTSPSHPAASHEAVPPSGQLVSRTELTALLAPTLGDEKSDEVVLDELRRAGYPRDTLTSAQALGILDSLGTAEGLVGVAARFAKMRMAARATKV